MVYAWFTQATVVKIYNGPMHYIKQSTRIHLMVQTNFLTQRSQSETSDTV